MSALSFITNLFCPCLFPRQRRIAPEENIPLLPIHRSEPTDSMVVQHTQPQNLADKPALVRQTIQNVLAQSKYVKRPEALLAPERNFSVLAEDTLDPTGEYPLKKITLKNFNEPLKTGPAYEGVCQDLALSVGKALEKKLGKDYRVEVATGFCPQYFQGGTHFFILATPKKSDNSSAGTILVDPSFGKIIENYRDMGADSTKYSISKRYELDEFYQHRGGADYSFKLLKPTLTSDLPASGSCIPLGYVRDIIPELVKKGDPNGAMLYLTFQISPENRETVRVSPSIQRHSHAAPYPMPESLLEQLPKEHPFVRLLDKIKADLHPPRRLHRVPKMLRLNLGNQDG
jgi:hypothetical protein